MNILEAIKSGKRFKHSSWSNNDWYTAIPNVNENISLQLPVCYLISDDWEVEEKEVPLTASLFDSKAKHVLDRCLYNTIDGTLGVVKLALADLKRELGL